MPVMNNVAVALAAFQRCKLPPFFWHSSLLLAAGTVFPAARGGCDVRGGVALLCTRGIISVTAMNRTNRACCLHAHYLTACGGRFCFRERSITLLSRSTSRWEHYSIISSHAHYSTFSALALSLTYALCSACHLISHMPVSLLLDHSPPQAASWPFWAWHLCQHFSHAPSLPCCGGRREWACREGRGHGRQGRLHFGRT